MATKITTKKRLVVYVTDAEYKAVNRRAKKEKRTLSGLTSIALTEYLNTK